MKALGVQRQDRQDDPEADQVDRHRRPDGPEARRQAGGPSLLNVDGEHHRQLPGQGDRSPLAVPQLAILLHQPVDEDAGPEGAEQPARAAGGPGRAPSARWSAPSPAAIDPSRVGGKASRRPPPTGRSVRCPSRKRIQPVISNGSPSPGPSPRAVGGQAEVEAVHDLRDGPARPAGSDGPGSHTGRAGECPGDGR